jgi:hypothetical protein
LEREGLRMRTEDRAKTSRLTRGLMVVSVAVGLLLLSAPAAQAKDEFEDAFKYELGRIAAHEAVRGGRIILAEILLGGYPPYPYSYYDYEPGPSYYEYHYHEHHYGDCGYSRGHPHRRWHRGWGRGHRKHGCVRCDDD